MKFSIIKSLQEEAKKLGERREVLPEDLCSLQKRLKGFEKNYRRCLGDMPGEKCNLSPKVEQKLLMDDTSVIQERVVYNTEEFVQVPAHIYYAKDGKGKRPGLLLVQGWDLDKWSLPFLKTRLAQEGYFVLFPDNRCSGERRREEGQTDIYALIAPRPLLIMNNSNDNWFPVSGYLEICRELEKVYRAFELPENFRHVISSNIHDITGIYEKETISWLAKHLKKSK